jgi:hypothetical protein
VTDRVYGYQFILTKGWEVNQLTGGNELEAKYSYVGGRYIWLAVQMRKRVGTLEYELGKLTTQQVGNFDKVLIKGIVTNGYGTTLAYLKSAKRILGLIRPAYYNEYDVIFIIEEKLIDINFCVIGVTRTEFSATDMQTIQAVQNSIQIN